MTSAARPLGHRFVHGPMTYSNDDDDTPVAAPPRVANVVVGNRHNRKDPTVTAIAEMLREVQDSLAALDDRLGKIEGAQGTSAVLTRQLAQNMVQIGESLSRRVKSLEQDVTAREDAAAAPPSTPAPEPAAASTFPAVSPVASPEGGAIAGPFAARPAASRRRSRAPLDTWVLAVGVAVLIALVGAGLWFLQRQSAPPAGRADPSAVHAEAVRAIPASAIPALNANAAAAEHATNDARPSERPHHYSLYPVHHGYGRHHAPAADDPAPPATGFGAYGPGTSGPTPG